MIIILAIFILLLGLLLLPIGWSIDASYGIRYKSYDIYTHKSVIQMGQYGISETKFLFNLVTKDYGNFRFGIPDGSIFNHMNKNKMLKMIITNGVLNDITDTTDSNSSTNAINKTEDDGMVE